MVRRSIFGLTRSIGAVANALGGLVRYDIGVSRCVLAATLTGPDRHSLKDLI